MHRNSKRPACMVMLLAPTLALLCAGCSGPQVETAPVKGVVTLNATPLAGVLVTFYPAVEGVDGLPNARTKTGADGTYQIPDEEGKPGAVVGKCRVVVQWPRERLDQRLEAKELPNIPVNYTVMMETPLVVNVKAGPQTIDLQLKTQ